MNPISDPTIRIDNMQSNASDKPSQPVWLVLTSNHHAPIEMQANEPAMERDIIIQHNERYYTYRGVDQRGLRWFRLYREVKLVTL